MFKTIKYRKIWLSLQGLFSLFILFKKKSKKPIQETLLYFMNYFI